MKKVLIAGESWMSYTTHVKGFDSFITSVYEEGVKYLQEALEKSGYGVDYIPNHKAPTDFPMTLEEMSEYDCIILSDIGSNTLLLHPDTFAKGKITPNRFSLINEYVKKGGSFMMIGGYMSFSGIDAKSRYGLTPLKDILPVKCVTYDDRMEHPEGVTPLVTKSHAVLEGIPKEWPHLLGYNYTEPIEDGEVIVEVNNHPLIALRQVEKGRTAVFTSDCAPHWGSPEFVNWQYYNKLFSNIVDFLVNKNE